MAIERTREEMPHGDQEQDHTLDRHKLGIRTLHCRSLFSPEVVAGTLQDIVYLICTGTIQCQWPRLRGGGVKHVMIGGCSAPHCPVQPRTRWRLCAGTLKNEELTHNRYCFYMTEK